MINMGGQLRNMTVFLACCHVSLIPGGEQWEGYPRKEGLDKQLEGRAVHPGWLDPVESVGDIAMLATGAGLFVAERCFATQTSRSMRGAAPECQVGLIGGRHHPTLFRSGS